MVEAHISVLLTAFVLAAALLGVGLASIGLQAMNGITESRVRQAVDDGTAGEYLERIYQRRLAAFGGLQALRSLMLTIVALAVFLLTSELAHNTWVVVAVTLAVSGLLLLIVEFAIPANVGLKYPAQIIRVGGRLLWWITRLATPFAGRAEPDDVGERETKHEDELKVMVERVSESDVLEDDERSMLRSVFELSHTLVREVMVPRTDMLTIDGSESLDRAISMFTRSGYSRIPVVAASHDDVQGVLYLKDVIRRTHRRNDADGLTVVDVMRDPVFVPETMLADDLLDQMQRDTFHIAFAVDEYGGIAGLVTIEDILEELVGEMVDEHDRALPEVEEVEPGVFRVPARMPISDLAEMFGLEIEDDDVDSAGGLLIKGLGRVPLQGAKAEIDGLVLQAERFEGRRKRLATVLAARSADSATDSEEEDDE